MSARYGAITMERPEIQFKGIDDRIYITLPYGALISVRLYDLQLVSQFFANQPDDARMSDYYMSLCGTGDVCNQELAVAGVKGTTISKIPVNINVWDHTNKGDAWTSKGFEGWPCTIAAFREDKEKEYVWCLDIHVAQKMFNQLLQRYDRQTLATLYVSLKTDMMIDEVDRNSSQRIRRLFLNYERGRTDFPTQAIGEVNTITFTEPKFTFAPLKEQETPHTTDAALTEVAALKERIQAIEQKLRLLTDAKPKRWLRL